VWGRLYRPRTAINKPLAAKSIACAGGCIRVHQLRNAAPWPSRGARGLNEELRHPPEARNGCLWPKADIPIELMNVRFWGLSGHPNWRAECPLLTQSRHQQLLNSNPLGLRPTWGPRWRSRHCQAMPTCSNISAAPLVCRRWRSTDETTRRHRASSEAPVSSWGILVMIQQL
jgi:hypothetical protein